MKKLDEGIRKKRNKPPNEKLYISDEIKSGTHALMHIES